MKIPECLKIKGIAKNRIVLYMTILAFLCHLFTVKDITLAETINLLMWVFVVTLNSYCYGHVKGYNDSYQFTRKIINSLQQDKVILNALRNTNPEHN